MNIAILAWKLYEHEPICSNQSMGLSIWENKLCIAMLEISEKSCKLSNKFHYEIEPTGELFVQRA